MRIDVIDAHPSVVFLSLVSIISPRMFHSQMRPSSFTISVSPKDYTEKEMRLQAEILATYQRKKRAELSSQHTTPMASAAAIPETIGSVAPSTAKLATSSSAASAASAPPSSSAVWLTRAELKLTGFNSSRVLDRDPSTQVDYLLKTAQLLGALIHPGITVSFDKDTKTWPAEKTAHICLPPTANIFPVCQVFFPCWYFSSALASGLHSGSCPCRLARIAPRSRIVCWKL